MKLKYFTLFVFLYILCPTGGRAQIPQILVGDNEVSLKQLFAEIEKQTSYTIGYSETDLDVDRRINVSALNYDLDKLMSLVLKNTGCRYLIKKNHILIVSLNKKNLLDKNPEKSYRGKVLSREESQPLPYATVRLLDHNYETLSTGITDSKGYYSIQSAGPVTYVQVNFTGYKTQTQTIQGKTPVLPAFYMEYQVTELDETVVSGSMSRFYVDRTVYSVTQEMRESVINALELLEKIPEFLVNVTDKTVKTGRNENVLLLIDGIQQSQEYIKSISPERILKIEIIHEPSGRFVSDNYSTIVNYILKKDYTGYDINIRNSMRINPAGTNGNDWLAEEQPEINFNFTKNKFTLFAHYDYERSRLNTPYYRFIRIGDEYSNQYVRTENVSLDDPNDSYSNELHRLFAGISYYITPKHMVSLHSEYMYTNSSSVKKYMINNSLEDYSGKYLFKDTTSTRIKDNEHKVSVSYRGQINDKIRLYSDLTYNRYRDDVDNYYLHEGWFEEQNIFKEKKNQVSLNLEGHFRLSSRHRSISGYSNLWRQYTSDSSTGTLFIDYKESRNLFFFYLISNWTESLQTKIGSGLEYIHTRSIDYRHTQPAVQPHLQVNYSPNKTLNFNLSYVTNTDNPSLYQLSIMPLTYDTIMSQKGNPELKTSINHLISTRLAYKDCLFFQVGFKHLPKGITETFEAKNGHIYKSFNNSKIQEYSLQLDYIQPFMKDFLWKNSVIYYFDRIKNEGSNNSLDGWMLNSRIDYFNTLHNFGLRLGYHRRMNKRIIEQGYQMADHDKWEITVRKYWWNRQIAVMLSYIPPIDWGVRYHLERKIDSPVFTEESYTNLKTYRNTLFVKVEFRFHKGRSRRGTGSSDLDNETKDRRKLTY